MTDNLSVLDSYHSDVVASESLGCMCMVEPCVGVGFPDCFVLASLPPVSCLVSQELCQCLLSQPSDMKFLR
jgi:hypothetical protein